MLQNETNADLASPTLLDQDSVLNGSLAIKAHATRMKTLTIGGKDDQMDQSQRTSSTYHTGMITLRQEEKTTKQEILEPDIDTLKRQHQELLDLQKHVQSSLAQIQSKLNQKQPVKAKTRAVIQKKTVSNFSYAKRKRDPNDTSVNSYS